MTVIQLPNKWRPRAYQMPLWSYMENGGKRGVAVWHRRAGKDDVCLNVGAVKAFERVGNYWHMLPMYSQARKAIWDAVNPRTGKKRIDEAFPVELRKTTRNQEMMIEFLNGSTWQVVGSDNFDSLVGTTPCGIVFSEFSIANPRAWAYLRPILAENDGWAMFIYTARGRNHGFSLLQTALKNDDWFGEVLTADKTGVFDEKTLESERQELIDMYGEEDGDSLFRQEYYCSFDAALLGAYYGKWIEKAENEGRVGNFPVGDGEVFTVWDLGYSDDTVIWFFQLEIGGTIRIIDYYASSGKDISHYVEILNKKGYLYGRHYMPHDAYAETIQGAGKSILKQMHDLGVRNIERVPDESVQQGIQAARNILPHCKFDKEKCDLGLESLRNYQREWNDDKKCFKDTPLHNWASHAADAFRYLALVWIRATKTEKPKPQPKFLHELTAHDVFFGESSKPTTQRL